MKVAPSEVFSLTPAQIHGLYFYKRDDKGNLVPPAQPREPVKGSFERDCNMVRSLVRDPAKLADALAKLKEKWNA